MNPIKLNELERIATSLAELCEGDEQLFSDMVEGETDADKVILRLHDQIQTDEALSAGMAARMANLRDRKARIDHRIAASKSAIGQVLRAVKLAKIELPEVTYSVRDGKAKLEIVDKDAVPDEYRRIKTEPDKALINQEFDGAETLPNWLAWTDATDVVVGRVK